MFRIIKRILHGKETVGYLLQSENGAILKVYKEQVLELAKAERLVNAKYSNSGQLEGTAGWDLRKLDCVQYSDLINIKHGVV